MERTFAQGGVTGQSLVAGNLLFSVARGEDDADIRHLFRENALGGWVRLSLEREPNAFDADFGLSRSHAFIIARDRETGEAIGICERSVRDAFVDGEIRPLPYLGSLRVAPAHRHRPRRITNKSVVNHANIQTDNITKFQPACSRQPMHHLVIRRNANLTRILPVSQKRALCAVMLDP